MVAATRKEIRSPLSASSPPSGRALFPRAHTMRPAPLCWPVPQRETSALSAPTDSCAYVAIWKNCARGQSPRPTPPRRAVCAPCNAQIAIAALKRRCPESVAAEESVLNRPLYGPAGSGAGPAHLRPVRPSQHSARRARVSMATLTSRCPHTREIRNNAPCAH